jgi:hypothetical protein
MCLETPAITKGKLRTDKISLQLHHNEKTIKVKDYEENKTPNSINVLAS